MNAAPIVIGLGAMLAIWLRKYYNKVEVKEHVEKQYVPQLPREIWSLILRQKTQQFKEYKEYTLTHNADECSKQHPASPESCIEDRIRFEEIKLILHKTIKVYMNSGGLENTAKTERYEGMYNGIFMYVRGPHLDVKNATILCHENDVSLWMLFYPLPV